MDSRFYLLPLICILIASCSNTSDQRGPDVTRADASLMYEATPEAINDVASSASDPQEEYPGRSIDQIFPILDEFDFGDEQRRGRSYSIFQAGYEIKVQGFSPRSISKNGRAVLQLKTKAKAEDYWSLLVGRSKLIGPGSDQLYIVSTGPGGPCCTNYWIVDISKGVPRLIFRSEEFGSFRDAMELFDADGDGIHELVQFDSCFRYFMDNCGSCSPEPRAMFKYNEELGVYRPARGILQDFARVGLGEWERRIASRNTELDQTNEANARFDQNSETLGLVAQLFHTGEDKKAWRVFRKYHGRDPQVEAEILHRLNSCKFIKALRRSAK